MPHHVALNHLYALSIKVSMKHHVIHEKLEIAEELLFFNFNFIFVASVESVSFGEKRLISINRALYQSFRASTIEFDEYSRLGPMGCVTSGIHLSSFPCKTGYCEETGSREMPNFPPAVKSSS